jgi:hypothetical protein
MRNIVRLPTNPCEYEKIFCRDSGLLCKGFWPDGVELSLIHRRKGDCAYDRISTKYHKLEIPLVATPEAESMVLCT